MNLPVVRAHAVFHSILQLAWHSLFLRNHAPAQGMQEQRNGHRPRTEVLGPRLHVRVGVLTWD